MKFADYNTRMFVFLCDKCKGPAPLIISELSRIPSSMEAILDAPCSCGHCNRKPGSAAVHVVELAFESGECFLLRNDSRLTQRLR
jgi:hypothetical protein